RKPPVGKHLCKFNGVGYMRKAAARGSGANKSAVRIGFEVVCVVLGREFEARLGTGSLVWGQEGRTPAGSGEAHQGGELDIGFHAAAPTRKGGERSWSWAAVSLSMTTMRPPHLGQSQSALGSWTGCVRFTGMGLEGSNRVS